MIGLIPIFFEGDEVLWRGGGSEPLLAKVFRAVGLSKALDKVFVVSDSKWVLELAQAYCFEALSAGRPVVEESKTLPFGTALGARLLQRCAPLTRSVFVIGFRNIPIGPESIAKAVGLADELGMKAGMSVVKSMDHPCQLKAYSRLGDTALIHCFDRSDRARAVVQQLCGSAKADKWEVCRPIYFNWAFKGVQGCKPGAFFRRQYSGMQTQYEQIYCGEEPHGLAPVWFIESELRARVLVPKAGFESSHHAGLELAGGTISDRLDAEGLFLYRDENGSYCVRSTSMAYSSTRIMLKLIPLGPEGPRVGELCELVIDDLEKGAPLSLQSNDLCGLIVSMIETVDDGPYDMSDVFRPSENLWLVSNTKSEAFLPDGTWIAGRQFFPDVFEPDGSFYSLAPKDAGRFDELVEEGGVWPLHMEDSDTVHVDSEFGVLRLKAVLEARSRC